MTYRLGVEKAESIIQSFTGAITGIGFRRPWNDVEFPQSESPSQKLLNQGALSLSDSELISLLHESCGNRRHGLDWARNLTNESGGAIGLQAMDYQRLRAIKGCDKPSAIRILAALELAKRLQQIPIPKTDFSSPHKIARYLRPVLSHEKQEVMCVIFLNNALRFLAAKELFRGGISQVIVDPRIIFRTAIEMGSSKIVLCHNHPSDDLIPSEQDCVVTKRIQEMAFITEINLVDHMILGSSGFFSMAKAKVLTALNEKEPSYKKIVDNLRHSRRKSIYSYAEEDCED